MLSPTQLTLLDWYVKIEYEEKDQQDILDLLRRLPPTMGVERFLALLDQSLEENQEWEEISPTTGLLLHIYINALTMANHEHSPVLTMAHITLAFNEHSDAQKTEWEPPIGSPPPNNPDLVARRARKAARKRQRLARRHTRR